MHPFINKAAEAARSAERIIRQSMHRLDRLEVAEKSANKLVSNVDKVAEQAIADVLTKAYPNHTIVGEEAGTINQGDGEFTWLIDPLDGTTNFLYGIPHFAVSIACLRESQPQHAFILDPIRQEEFSASRGQGALLNRKRIRVAEKRRLSEALVGGGVPFPGQQGEVVALQTLATQAGRLCRGLRCQGCSTLDLAYVAAGRLDGYFDTGLATWDIAAGALLVQEAGGLIADFNGEQNFLKTGTVLTGSPGCFQELLPLAISAAKTQV